jgi:hypothetical protein
MPAPLLVEVDAAAEAEAVEVSNVDRHQLGV